MFIQSTGMPSSGCYNLFMGISTKFTHADLLAIPDDGKRREIVNGEPFVTPSPNLEHQRISQRLETAFTDYLKQHPIGEFFHAPLDVILSEFDVLEPDVLFVLNERRTILDRKDWVRGAPDIVLEILSSSTESNDRGPKLKAYARFGVPEYWIVDPEERAIEVYLLGKEGYEPPRIFREQESLTSLVLPGFALPVGKAFESD